LSMAEEKKKRAKPVRVTKQLMISVAERLAKGESLLRICEEEGMPEYHAITRAVIRDPELHDIYREGRVRQAEHYSDRINTLANDPLPTHHADGTPCDSRWLGAEIQRRKLEVEALKWTLARTQPYGIRDKKEDAPQQQSAITISWAGGDVAVSGKE
jgi:hypothetical protein